MSDKRMNEERTLAAKKAAFEAVREFDQLIDPDNESPLALWSLAECLGVYTVMSAEETEHGRALAQIIDCLTSGAMMAMEIKNDWAAEMAAE
ncbi:hypothetical protein CRP738_gp62 [Roseobacter phage CRP-738]|nr:hypothetical protein CRP738_gp62 [Roseobacter phage CRP-738]